MGTSISNARVVDFAMDIIEIEGKPVAKRGKMSGAKRVIRCLDCYKDRIIPFNQDIDSGCECGGYFVDLLNPWYENGTFLSKSEPPQHIRRYMLEQLKYFEI